MNTSYEAGNRDVANQNCKYSETVSVSIVRGIIRKDAVGLRYFGQRCDTADGAA